MFGPLQADQAIFTSMGRGGNSGYHLVSRSPGVNEIEAGALAKWCPSQGLIRDGANAVSVNFHPLPTGRFALARTCQGPMEYSGRGGYQLYTHALILDNAALRAVDYRVFALYREAMALGLMIYHPNPEPVLKPAEFLEVHRILPPDAWEARARSRGLPLAAVRNELGSAQGKAMRFPYAGDRVALAECLMGSLDARTASSLSFSTSLQASNVRPFRLCLVGA